MFIKYYCVSEVFLYKYELDFIPEHKYQIQQGVYAELLPAVDTYRYM